MLLYSGFSAQMPAERSISEEDIYKDLHSTCAT